MGAKAKKAMKKNLKKASSQLVASARKTEAADFCSVHWSGATWFYEKEMEGFFTQFGKVKRLRIARNKKTGKSKHFGFIEFESPEVAKIVADCMHNQLLFEHLLQVHLIPPEHVHPKLWRGFNYRYQPVDGVQIERKRQNKERTLKEHMKLVEKIMKRDLKRKNKIEAAGIEYESPEIVGSVQPAPKKIKFDDE
ncbi:hypothetical protein SLA2020_451070 [Shorea laevis]